MRERIINTRLKTDIEQFVIEKLENCELFVRVYGKGFAKEQLKKNFRYLYTEGKDPFYGGCFYQSLIIEIFSKGKKGELLTFEDLEQNDNLYIALHECVHAIFNKTKKECKKIGCKGGTGFREWYGKGGELGRGLNEGFTNWVCEKAGVSTKGTYKIYTRLVYLLELAIGEENVMNFGNGNIKKNISKLLNMNVKECQTFLSQIDEVYNLERLVERVEKLKICLEDKLAVEQERINNPSLETPAEVTENIEYLNRQEMYINIKKNKDYITFSEERGLNIDDDNTKKEYFEFLNKKYKKNIKEMIEEVVAEVYNKYFKKEIEDLVNEPRITLEQLIRMFEIKRVIGTVDNEDLKTFYQNCQKIEEREKENACQSIVEQFEKGVIILEKIDEEMEKLKLGSDKIKEELLQKISEMMMLETPQVYKNFLKRVIENGKLSDVINYKILELQTESGKKEYLYFNEKAKIYLKNRDCINVKATDNVDENDWLFSFTMDMTQEEKVIQSFVNLKNQVCEEYPNAKFEIYGRVIIQLVEGEEPIYYIIEENDIKKAMVKELVTKNAEIKVNEKKSFEYTIEEIKEKKIYLEKIFNNPFKRIVSFFKRKFFGVKQDSVVTSTQANEEKETIINYTIVQANNFDSRIRVEKEKLITDFNQLSTPNGRNNTPVVIKDGEELGK